MKETSFLLRPPTVCPSCRLSQKNHSQAKSERRGGGGRTTGRTESTFWTCQQGKAKRRRGEFPSWTIPIVLLRYQTFLSRYLREHRTTRTFPVVTLSSPFFFFSFSPLASFLFPSPNVHPRSTSGFQKRNVFILCLLPSPTHFNPSHIHG